MPHSAEEGLKCTAAYLAPKTLTVESQVLQKHCQGHTFIKVLLCVNENVGVTQKKGIQVLTFCPSFRSYCTNEMRNGNLTGMSFLTICGGEVSEDFNVSAA